jgi:hypothetical protein
MFTRSQLLAAAQRFEMANGRALEQDEHDCVVAAGLGGIELQTLVDQICSILDLSLVLESDFRSTAFWALGKSYDSRLVEFFRRHLGREVERDMAVAYQIMIALDNLDEPIWQADKQSFGVNETELNYEAAVRYLGGCA